MLKHVQNSRCSLRSKKGHLMWKPQTSVCPSVVQRQQPNPIVNFHEIRYRSSLQKVVRQASYLFRSPVGYKLEDHKPNTICKTNNISQECDHLVKQKWKEVPGVLHVTISIVTWFENTHNICINVTLRRVRATIFAVEKQ